MKAAFSIAALLIIGNVQAQYFQQDVAYNIRVELDDKNHILRGDEFHILSSLAECIQEQ